jgi:hypothetical protein
MSLNNIRKLVITAIIAATPKSLGGKIRTSMSVEAINAKILPPWPTARYKKLPTAFLDEKALSDSGLSQ